MSTATLARWPNQIAAVEGTEAAIRAGHRKICVTSPTGGGKSLIACDLIQTWCEQDLKTVVYTNRKMLVEQLTGVVKDFGIEHGVRAAGYQDNRHLDVQISSIQTEHARVLNAQRWELHDADRVLIDEAHLQRGDMAQKILEMHNRDGAAYVGLTATPLDIGHLYDHLIVAGKTSELRRCKALLPCHHYGPDEPDTKHISRQKSGEFSENDVRKVIMTSTIFARVYDWWKVLNPDAKPAILFAPGVGESIWFCEQFAAKGVRCAHIDGKECWLDGKHYRTSRNLRADILEGSKDGSIKLLCNRFVLREGIDCPWLYHGIFATVYGSLQSYIQSGGRLLRAHPSLDHVVLQDHGGNWWRHGSLNADRHWELDQNANIVNGLREEKLRNKLEPEPIRCPQCATIRASGPACPKCGFESHKKSRPVVQKDGTLKEHTGDIFKPRRVDMRPNTLDLWRQMYFRARKSKNEMTFRQAEALFFVENHYYPPRDLPFMPTREIDWFAPVHEIPAGRLTT